MNEDLIEAATWALIEYDTDVSDRGVRDEHYRERRADAERVLAVFEDAWSHEHTVNVSREDWERLKRIEAAQAPTDDEREALANLIPLDLVHDAGREGFPRNASEAADRIIASDVWRSRRPVSPSPALGDLENHLGRTSEGTALLPALWALAGVSPEPSAGPFSSRHENGLPEPQTEPTRNPCEFKPQAEPTDVRETIRQALRNAGEGEVFSDAMAGIIARALRAAVETANENGSK